MSKPSWEHWFESELGNLESRSLLRVLARNTPGDALHVTRDGQRLTVFSSNDYLGLSSASSVVEASRNILQQYGNGPRGSPLVCGYTTEHAALELELAKLKGSAAALLFPTGFAANVSVLSALGTRGVTVFSDELNHASIIDGCRLARRNGARIAVYRHGDVDHLAELMEADDSDRKLIVSDSVFSMDGDLAPLTEIAELADTHDALVVIDEAHATLVYGERGGGVSQHLGVADQIDVHVGTMSKAFGCQGGFVATTDTVRQHLLNNGRPYVFSTALPLPVVAGARAAIREAKDGSLRRRVFDFVEMVAGELGIEAHGPIIPIVIGSENDALRAAELLREEGMLVPAIRPPTVPNGTSRLRVTVSAGHEEEEVKRLIGVLRDLPMVP
jgi:8-amino-7-oxononanoate synthase